jgi:hypothetical protein
MQIHNLKPHRTKTFKLSRDARFPEKLTDSPQEGDWRQVVSRQIRERRGQSDFARPCIGGMVIAAR